MGFSCTVLIGDTKTSNWTKYNDSISGNDYYYNEITNKVTWIDPETNPDETLKNQIVVFPWVRIFDPVTKKDFYWNADSDDTEWDIPKTATTTSTKLTI